MTSRSWQMHEAKNKLAEVLDRARAEGPQVITRHGREDGAVISADDLKEYRRLKASDAGSRRPSFKEFLEAAPIADLDLVRDKSPPRDVPL
jgi:prevent-host-death family protein